MYVLKGRNEQDGPRNEEKLVRCNPCESIPVKCISRDDHLYSTACQHQHMKCNFVHPSCGSCARLGRVCDWPVAVRFKHDSNPSVEGSFVSFAHSQEWVDMPKELQVFDETIELRMIYEKESSPTQSGDFGLNPTFPGTGLPQRSPTTATLVSPYPQQNPISLGANDIQQVSGDATLISLRLQRGRSFLLEDGQEAQLVGYFVDKLSPWFDVGDFNKHFATVAPRRAISNPTLLNAICALAARHLSRTGGFDPLVTDRFYQACLSILIPALDNPDVLMDENLLAATVILRLFEELNDFDPLEHVAESQHLSHAFGVQVLLGVQKYTEVDRSLGQAAFQVAMRQEIGVAYQSQRPVLPSLMQHITNLSFSPATQGVWGCRSSTFLALALQFCYGSEEKTLERWQYLVDYRQHWLEFRPHEFEPFYYKDLNTDEFPTINYLASVHVLTANHYSLGWLLLTAYDPRLLNIEKIGGENDSTKKIKNIMRELCGTASSNLEVAPAMLSACRGIATFGGRFSELKEQLRLYEILIRTEKQHGWSTAVARRNLMKTWGWES